MTLMLSTDKVP